jgi:hypothetical protein
MSNLFPYSAATLERFNREGHGVFDIKIFFSLFTSIPSTPLERPAVLLQDETFIGPTPCYIYSSIRSPVHGRFLGGGGAHLFGYRGKNSSPTPSHCLPHP